MESQLAALAALSRHLAGASAISLTKLRDQITGAVASSQSIAQQVKTNMTAAISAEAAAMASQYRQATAALDARAAVVFQIDRRHFEMAHDMAAEQGIDLSEYDRERARLERARALALAMGNHQDARQIDVQIAQNTKDSMVAVGMDQADINAQTAVINTLQGLATEQARLDAAYQSQTVTGHRPTANSPTTATATPSIQDRVEADLVAATVAADFNAFASSLTLDNAAQISLSAAPDAHTKVEVPPTKVATNGTHQRVT